MTTETLNSLSNASSSYLRSAMHQPIRWHEWGDEAFELAKRENKPILLDIGAVWCHWCHVMAEPISLQTNTTAVPASGACSRRSPMRIARRMATWSNKPSWLKAQSH